MSRWREPGRSIRRLSDNDRPSLEAVLEHYDVMLRPGRRSGMTNCPLHEDRTPSLSFNLDKQVFNCHSCGHSGDAYALIMEKEGTDFDGARAFVAALNLPAGGAGGSNSNVSGGYLGQHRRVPTRKGDKPRDGGFIPSWRRG